MTTVANHPIPAAPPAPAGDYPPRRVVEWVDPVLQQTGHEPRSRYVAEFWLPTLGPTATWLMSKFAALLEECPQGFDLDPVALACELGLGAKTGRSSVFGRGIARCCHFGLARQVDTTLHVRQALPTLTPRQVRRLPPRLVSLHDAWSPDAWSPEVSAPDRERGRAATHEPERTRERARRLALTLAELGDTPDAIERQLHDWAFHPAVAWEALRAVGCGQTRRD